jgi:hypothetical protein
MPELAFPLGVGAGLRPCGRREPYREKKEHLY